MALRRRPPPLIREVAAAKTAPTYWLLLVVLALPLLLRFPSFLDPPWVNDEGTYFAVAQALSHGYHLYSGVWENKPPALYMLYTAVYHLWGPSLLALRLLSTLAALVTTLLVWAIGRSCLPRDHALVATLLAGLLFTAPLLNGTDANAESFLAVFATLAVYLGIIRGHGFGAALAITLACTFKPVAVFDAAAIGLWLLLHHRRQFGSYAAGTVVGVGSFALAAAVTGILVPMLHIFLYDGNYVDHGNGGGLPWLLMLKLGTLAIVAVWLRRGPFPYLWLAFAAAGVLFSGRFFGHYALQAVGPLALSAALVLAGRIEARRLLLLLLGSFVGAAIACTIAGLLLAANGQRGIMVARLQYYTNAARYALGTETYGTYRGQIDDHVNRNLRVATDLTRLPPGRLLIWGNIPWVYVLSHRLPATPYTSALREPPVPGEWRALYRSLRNATPRTVVVVRPAAPPLGAAKSQLASRYRAVARVDNAIIYVRRRRWRASESTTARTKIGTR